MMARKRCENCDNARAQCLGCAAVDAREAMQDFAAAWLKAWQPFIDACAKLQQDHKQGRRP